MGIDNLPKTGKIKLTGAGSIKKKFHAATRRGDLKRFQGYEQEMADAFKGSYIKAARRGGLSRKQSFALKAAIKKAINEKSGEKLNLSGRRAINKIVDRYKKTSISKAVAKDIEKKNKPDKPKTSSAMNFSRRTAQPRNRVIRAKQLGENDLGGSRVSALANKPSGAPTSPAQTNISSMPDNDMLSGLH